MSQAQLAVTKSALLGATAHSDPQLSTIGRKAKEVLSGVLNITQIRMATRRSYGLI